MRRGLLAGPPSGMGSRASSPRVSLGSMAECLLAAGCHRGVTLATAHHSFIPPISVHGTGLGGGPGEVLEDTQECAEWWEEAEQERCCGRGRRRKWRAWHSSGTA